MNNKIKLEKKTRIDVIAQALSLSNNNRNLEKLADVLSKTNKSAYFSQGTRKNLVNLSIDKRVFTMCVKTINK